MSGDAFVVGDGFVIDERALSKLGSGHHDAAWAFAVRSAGHVVGCSGGLKGRYCFNGDRRLGKKGEKLRKFRLHLSNVAAEIVEDLIGGGRNVFGIRFEGSPESG